MAQAENIVKGKEGYHAPALHGKGAALDVIILSFYLHRLPYAGIGGGQKAGKGPEGLWGRTAGGMV